MLRWILGTITLVLPALLVSPDAKAQTAKTVGAGLTCDTIPAQPPGSPTFIWMGLDGKICVAGAGGGGGSVTIANPLGIKTDPALAVSVQGAGTPYTGYTLPAGATGDIGYWSAIIQAINGGAYTDLITTLTGYVAVGGRGSTAFPTAAADGKAVPGMGDKYGRTITYPMAPDDLVWRASCTFSSGTTCDFGSGSLNASLKTRTSWVECFRTDQGTTTVAAVMGHFNDTATTPIMMGGGAGGSGIIGRPEFNLVGSAINTKSIITWGSAISGECGASGYFAP